jgi:hypothetical protein
MAITTRSIKLNDFAQMSRQERDICTDELFKAAANSLPDQESKKSLEFEIQSFEEKYKMSSEAMKEKVLTRQIVEKPDFSQWMVLLRIREQCYRES